MSIEIHNVDTLETYPRIDYLNSPEDLFSNLPKPQNDYFLISSSGQLIDISQPTLPQPLPNTFYLFKKSSVVTTCEILKSSPEKFPLTTPYRDYKEPINFADYRIILEPYDRIQVIEKSLFNNFRTAKELYTEFQIYKEWFNKTKTLAKIRLEASTAIRLYIVTYFEQRQKEFEIIKEVVDTMHRKIMKDSTDFRDKIGRLQRLDIPDNIKDLVQQCLKGYGSTISDKSGKLWRKILKIEQIFEKLRLQIDDSEMSYERAKGTVARDFTFVEENFFSFDFGIILTIVMDYKLFRETFTEAEEAETKKQAEKRQICAQKMLAMEGNVESGNDIINEIKQRINSLKANKKIDETQKRIQTVYKGKIIETFVKVTQQIKYSFSEKLKNLWKSYEKIDKQKEFLTIPERLKEACVNAETEDKRSQLKIMDIQELYISLCQGIIKDHSERKDFLQKFGAILPKETCSGLVGPVINRSYLRQLVKLQPFEELPEIQVKQMPKDDLIRYYEGRLAAIEKNYSVKMNALKSKEKKLQDHYVYLLGYKEKVSKDVAGQENLLKKYLEQLAGHRSKNASETYARMFQKEVDKLKEKEKAFKSIHLLNLRSLLDENSKLKTNKR